MLPAMKKAASEVRETTTVYRVGRPSALLDTRVIVPFTVREILDKRIAGKLA